MRKRQIKIQNTVNNGYVHTYYKGVLVIARDYNELNEKIRKMREEE